MDIVINGIIKKIPDGTQRLSYEEIVELAYGKRDKHPLYTMTWSQRYTGLGGILSPGRSIQPLPNMIFNVAWTGAA